MKQDALWPLVVAADILATVAIGLVVASMCITTSSPSEPLAPSLSARVAALEAQVAELRKHQPEGESR